MVPVGEGRAKVVTPLTDIQLLHPVTTTMLEKRRDEEERKERRRERRRKKGGKRENHLLMTLQGEHEQGKGRKEGEEGRGKVRATYCRKERRKGEGRKGTYVCMCNMYVC